METPRAELRRAFDAAQTCALAWAAGHDVDTDLRWEARCNRCGTTPCPSLSWLRTGDVTDTLGHEVTRMWIQGREVDLDNRHRQLARKYREKIRRTAAD